jgi:Dolichyl-phosphate-mannose-protein mannosyltransferase
VITAVASRRSAPAVAPARSRWLYWLPLAVILIAQALLSARLISGTYASGDEGRYIYAGHQLLYEIWHGGGSPYYETYFSGAPVIYPVLAAIADSVGGLVAACLMSTVFMVIATIMLFAVTRDLFGYWSGLLAAGLFAGLGLTQDLGALATYDAMSLMLISIAAYCAVQTGKSRDDQHGDSRRESTGWLLAIPVILFLANATKYMTLIFDPAVMALAALQVSGWKAIVKRITALGLATLTLDSLFLFLAGGAYLNGLLFSTLARKSGTSAVFAAVRVTNPVILTDTWKWIGPVIAASLLALAIALLARSDAKTIATIGLLIGAGLIVTLEGLHLHTVESMRKHDDFSAWFACAATGSIAARLHGRRLISLITAVGIGCVVAASGFHYTQAARSTYEAGGSQTTLEIASDLRPYLSLPGGRFLIGGLASEQLVFIDGLGIRWFQLADDLYIKYPVPGRGGDSHGQVMGPACFHPGPRCMYLEGLAGYRAAIHAHWFDLITMWGGHGIRQDTQIERAVEHTPGYVLISIVDGAPTWIYAPAYRHLT